MGESLALRENTPVVQCEKKERKRENSELSEMNQWVGACGENEGMFDVCFFMCWLLLMVVFLM